MNDITNIFENYETYKQIEQNQQYNFYEQSYSH